jgi:hypothetical protein
MEISAFIEPFKIDPCTVDELPSQPIIYFLTEGESVAYIGAAANPQSRFVNHSVIKKHPELKIRPLVVPMDCLLSVESLLIERLNPKLNKVKPKTHLAPNQVNTAQTPNTCKICAKPLRHNNKSGYCTNHAEYRPSRKNRKTAKYRDRG